MIKAIIFDVDGVLVDSRKANVALFQNVLIKAGYPKPSEEAVLQCFHMTALDVIETLTGSKDKNEIKRVWELIKDGSVNQPELFEFPKTLEHTLEHLHNRYMLAIVTSRIKLGIDQVFDARQIKHLFDVVITFEDYKNPKPHPEPLIVALKRLGLPASEAIYIGDSDTDIVAATAAGMKSIHLSSKPHAKASIHISKFEELLKAIDQLPRY